MTSMFILYLKGLWIYYNTKFKLWYAPRFDKSLLSKKKAISLGFKTLKNYNIWFYSTNTLSRTVYFFTRLNFSNKIFRYTYFLESGTKKNIFVNFIRLFLVTFFLFYIFFSEGLKNWSFLFKRRFKKIFHFLERYFLYSVFFFSKIFTWLVYNFFYLLFLIFIIAPFNYVKESYFYFRNIYRTRKILKRARKNAKAKFTHFLPHLSQAEEYLDYTAERMNSYCNPFFLVERGYDERKELLQTIYRRKKGWFKHFKKERRFYKHSSFANYLFFNFFTWLWIRLYDLFYLTPLEKLISLYILIIRFLRAGISLYDKYWSIALTAIIPVFLTNVIFFILRFLWISFITAPIPYTFLWLRRTLLRWGWVKSHHHCWWYWAAYWRILLIIRYTFSLPAHYYRQPVDYGTFIHLPYAQRKPIFRYYSRYVPYYGFILLFTCFQMCMFLFPPTWNYTSIYLGPIKLF